MGLDYFSSSSSPLTGHPHRVFPQTAGSQSTHATSRPRSPLESSTAENEMRHVDRTVQSGLSNLTMMHMYEGCMWGERRGVNQDWRYAKYDCTYVLAHARETASVLDLFSYTWSIDVIACQRFDMRLCSQQRNMNPNGPSPDPAPVRAYSQQGRHLHTPTHTHLILCARRVSGLGIII